MLNVTVTIFKATSRLHTMAKYLIVMSNFLAFVLLHEHLIIPMAKKDHNPMHNLSDSSTLVAS